MAQRDVSNKMPYEPVRARDGEPGRNKQHAVVKEHSMRATKGTAAEWQNLTKQTVEQANMRKEDMNNVVTTVEDSPPKEHQVQRPVAAAKLLWRQRPMKR